MSTHAEIMDMENRLRAAELGPDPNFFEEALADDAVLDGQLTKSKVVEAHRPDGGAKFTKVEMSDYRLYEHGQAVVVTCTGFYEGPQGSHTLKFMRVWLKSEGRWQIIAGSVAVPNAK
jgi:hypothetical protein